MKRILEDAELRKSSNRRKQQESKVEKKKRKFRPNVGGKRKDNLKKQIRRRPKHEVHKKVKFLESDSEYSDFDEKPLCDDSDTSDINLENVVGEEICLICGEFGRNDELCYRCVICALWCHEECSGWDSPVNYTCDLCLKKEK